MQPFADILGDDESTAGDAQLVRLEEAVRMVPVSRATVYRLIKAGQFPKPVKIGSGSFILKSELRAWMEAKVAERS